MIQSHFHLNSILALGNNITFETYVQPVHFQGQANVEKILMQNKRWKILMWPSCHSWGPCTLRARRGRRYFNVKRGLRHFNCWIRIVPEFARGLKVTRTAHLKFLTSRLLLKFLNNCVSLKLHVPYISLEIDDVSFLVAQFPSKINRSNWATMNSNVFN